MADLDGAIFSGRTGMMAGQSPAMQVANVDIGRITKHDLRGTRTADSDFLDQVMHREPGTARAVLLYRSDIHRPRSQDVMPGFKHLLAAKQSRPVRVNADDVIIIGPDGLERIKIGIAQCFVERMLGRFGRFMTDELKTHGAIGGCLTPS